MLVGGGLDAKRREVGRCGEVTGGAIHQNGRAPLRGAGEGGDVSGDGRKGTSKRTEAPHAAADGPPSPGPPSAGGMPRMTAFPWFFRPEVD